MSHIKKPTEETTPQDPITLSDDPQALLLEYHAIQAQLTKMNEEIKEKQAVVASTQTEIDTIRQQGLQFIGQANVLFRILKGKGIDPNTTAPTPQNPQIPEPKAPTAPTPVPAVEEKAAEVSPAAQTLRNRFPRR